MVTRLDLWSNVSCISRNSVPQPVEAMGGNVPDDELASIRGYACGKQVKLAESQYVKVAPGSSFQIGTRPIVKRVTNFSSQ